MKVAVLFYGQMRFVNNPWPVKSHKQLESIYDVSYFGHLWNSNSDKLKHVSSWSRIKGNPFTSNDLGQLKKNYNFISLEIEEPIDFLVTQRDKIDKIQNIQSKIGRKVNKETNLRDLSNTISHIYSMEKSIKRFLNYENAKDYDWVILSRTDNFIVRFPDLRSLDISQDAIFISAHHDNFPDTVILSTPKNVKSLLAYSKLDEMINFSPPVITGAAEKFKQVSIQLCNPKVDILSLRINPESIKSICVIINDDIVGMQKAELQSGLYSRFVRHYDLPPSRDHDISLANKEVWQPKE